MYQNAMAEFQTATQGQFEMTRLQTESALERSLDNGLRRLYKDVFGDPPYNEVFTDAEVDEIFTDYWGRSGAIFTIQQIGETRPVAFIVGTDLKDKFATVAGMPSQSPLGYIAEDGVEKRLRRRGFSTAMKRVLLGYAKENTSYEGMILRTRADNVPQIMAIAKTGGQYIQDAQQTVTRTTKNGTVQEDNRFFYYGLR